MKIDPTTHEGAFVPIVAVNPQSVACEQSLLVSALRSVGIPLHPKLGFQKTLEYIDGKTQTVWHWLLGEKSQDGVYITADLVKRWNDSAWIKANPLHEWAILCNGLRNLGMQAAEIREQVSYTVVRKGNTAAYIPDTASELRAAHLIGQLEGTIPLNEKFVEPTAA